MKIRCSVTGTLPGRASGVILGCEASGTESRTTVIPIRIDDTPLPTYLAHLHAVSIDPHGSDQVGRNASISALKRAILVHVEERREVSEADARRILRADPGIREGSEGLTAGVGTIAIWLPLALLIIVAILALRGSESPELAGVLHGTVRAESGSSLPRIPGSTGRIDEMKAIGHDKQQC